MFKNINIFRSLIAILILFIPLYPKFPISSVSGTYVAIRLDDIVIAITILIWLIYQLTHRLPATKFKITRLFIAYFLAIIASTISGIFIYQVDPSNILILHLLRRFEYISLFFIAINSIKTIKDLYFPYIFLLITTALVDFFGYGQKFLNFPVISTMNSEFSKGQLLQMDVWTRISSTFAGHYDLAAYMSVVLIIIGVVAITTKNITLKIFSLIVWIASYYIFTLTASRVSTFAFFGGMCLALFLLKKYLWILPVTILVVFSIINSKDLNQRLLATIPALKTQLAFLQSKSQPTATPTIKLEPTPTIIVSGVKTTIAPIKPTPTIVRHTLIEEQIPVDSDVGVARSGEIRFNVEWPRAITAFKKNMLLGTGLGSLTLATDNDYLRSLGESGFLGFISFMAIQLFFIIKTIPIIFKKQRNFNENLSIIFLSCQLTTLANAVFIDVFEASKTAYLFWLMMGIFYQTLTLKPSKS
jgi:hypothetical protein